MLWPEVPKSEVLAILLLLFLQMPFLILQKRVKVAQWCEELSTPPEAETKDNFRFN